MCDFENNLYKKLKTQLNKTPKILVPCKVEIIRTALFVGKNKKNIEL
jgi:hypothetical protein